MIVKNGGICFGNASIRRGGIAQNTVKWSDGTYLASDVTQQNMYLNEANRTNDQRGVKMRLGVGDTSPTINDYWLDDVLVDGVDINTKIQCTSAQIGTNNKGDVIYTYTFSNTTGNTYTIKELCLAMTPSGTSGTDVPNGRHIMLARTIIPARTVGAYETISFTYTVNPCGGA